MTFSRQSFRKRSFGTGYTLVELMVSIGLFALVMTLAAGAYLIMISVNNNAQALSSGINNLSFALESMTRNIRTGYDYTCPGGQNSCTEHIFSFTNSRGVGVTYGLDPSGKTLEKDGSTLTDPTVVITGLTFYVTGVNLPPNDYTQPQVTIVISGTVSSGKGKSESFTVETGATQRRTDL